MREIRYRAKSRLNGQWVYGIPQNTAIDNWLIGSEPIDPETIGEWTGVDDVEGNPIYEGDIVETFCVYLAYQQVGNYPPPNIEVEEYKIKQSVNEVVFSDGSFDIDGFPIMFVDKMTDDEADWSRERLEFEAIWADNSYNIKDRYPYLTWDYFRKPHVIGNIHDNPELLTSHEARL